jgi:polyhydroxyalkanoate synthesis regulator phasin
MRLVEKSLLLGLGVLTLTRDKVVKFVNSLVEEGEVRAEEAPGIVDRLVARGEEEREELRKMVREELEKARASLPFVSRKDIEALNQKIDQLALRLDELSCELAARKKGSG